MKLCSVCKQEKPIEEFCINKATKDGRNTFCRECAKKKKKAFSTSERGVIVTMYDSQKLSCRLRNHPMPAYTLNELQEWVFSQPNWSTLYSAWVESGYKSRMKPSVDRLDDFKTYSFDNIRLVTFRENESKGHKQRHLGIGTQGQVCKAVIQYDKEVKYIKRYASAALAELEVPKANRQNIQKVCNGERPLCAGFIWKWE